MEVSAHLDPEAREFAAPEAGYERHLFVAACVFVAAIVLVYRPASFDVPLVHLCNSYADRSVAVDRMFHGFERYFTFSGVVLMGLVWSCWVGTRSLELRARIVSGCVGSVGAGVASRWLQHALTTHPRPMYDPALQFHLPVVFGARNLNTWNSFPSDHVAVFAGLVAVLFVARAKLRWAALSWTVLVESARVYAGAHYPSDLVGGAALGCGAVWATQAPALLHYGRRVVHWAESSPRASGFLAFVVSYQIATLFVDIRGMSLGVALLAHGR